MKLKIPAFGRKVSQEVAQRYIRRFGGKITQGNNGCMRLLDIWLEQVAFFKPNDTE